MAKANQADHRKLMERAVEVMRMSVQEHRVDGSPSPLVGAVIVLPDGTVEQAYRGELRDGDHAEFTLLDQKLIGKKLDGSVLYTTLEPCIKRTPPKRGCARRVAGARIKTVYVGIEDDNPAVAGKGMQYLRDRGVEVFMFDNDLQQQILEANAEFFDWARQQTDDRVETSVPEPALDGAAQKYDLSDLSVEALEKYRTVVGISDAVDSQGFRRRLSRLGLIAEVDGVLRPTGFGVLLFGEEPRAAYPQAGLLAKATLPDGKASRQEFDLPLVLIPPALERWLDKTLPSVVDRSRSERREQVDLPFEMLREAVVNALVHRDYELGRQKCQVQVDVNTIVIRSPGGPVKPNTLSDLQAFNASQVSRNPKLHHVMARMHLAEEQGIGLQSLKEEAQKLGLPLPQFAMNGGALSLTIFRSAQAATAVLSEAVRSSLSKSELSGWQWLATQREVKVADYAAAMELPERTARDHMSTFVESGMVRRVGKGRATRYEIVGA